MEANFIPGVLSLLQDEWGFGDTAAGAIPTAMAIAGLVVTLPAGYLADRHNRTTVLALVVASWSVFTLASALATSFAMFFAIRVLLGTAAHIDNPCSSSLITDFYPAESRARVFALQRAALVRRHLARHRARRRARRGVRMAGAVPRHGHSRPRRRVPGVEAPRARAGRARARDDGSGTGARARREGHSRGLARDSQGPDAAVSSSSASRSRSPGSTGSDTGFRASGSARST